MNIPAFYETPGPSLDVADRVVEKVRDLMATEEDAAVTALASTPPDRWGTLMFVSSLRDATRSVACRWDWPEPDRHPGADRPCP